MTSINDRILAAMPAMQDEGYWPAGLIQWGDRWKIGREIVMTVHAHALIGWDLQRFADREAFSVEWRPGDVYELWSRENIDSGGECARLIGDEVYPTRLEALLTAWEVVHG